MLPRTFAAASKVLSRSSLFRASCVRSLSSSHAPQNFPQPNSIEGRQYGHGAIDVHTHCYLQRYMDVLRDRHPNVPYVVPDPRDPAADERYVILPGEDDDPTSAIGRPIGEEYFSVEQKLRYMDRHGIAISVMSLANPWLDFLPKHDAVAMSTLLNDDLQEVSGCESRSDKPVVTTCK